ncbi:MAG: hypothetical protein HUU55_19140 [Myxococcales bacterium]|nr:hypothetical protein [Myxococcales bacterium]
MSKLLCRQITTSKAAVGIFKLLFQWNVSSQHDTGHRHTEIKSGLFSIYFYSCLLVIVAFHQGCNENSTGTSKGSQDQPGEDSVSDATFTDDTAGFEDAQTRIPEDSNEDNTLYPDTVTPDDIDSPSDIQHDDTMSMDTTEMPAGGPAYYLSGDCDPIVPSHCGLPFPSNVYTVPDPTSNTGIRVQFGATTLVKTKTGVQSSPGAFGSSDGFSPSPMILAHFPDHNGQDLNGPNNIEHSLLDLSTTTILDAETGERIPHFAELDAWAKDDTRRALIIYPAVRLKDATRYIVAIRGLKDHEGALLEPTEVFLALRDKLPHDHPTVERRRDWYEDIFERLAAAGIQRDTLQLAWDFTTASQANNTNRMLHMRNVAFSQYGKGNAPYVFDKVDDDLDRHIARRIEGRITVPLFLDKPGPGGVMVLGPNGLPVQNGTAEYPFLILIPHSVVDQPGRLVQFGHGLFGSRYVADSNDYRFLANQYQSVIFATDFIGMSEADPPVIANVILSGEADGFRTVPDRSQQGFLTMLVLMRNMLNSMAQDPTISLGGSPPYMTDMGYYLGGSQGGIYGATYLSLSADILRGVLAVPGQSYALMLPRSIHFIPFQGILSDVYSDPIDHMFVLSVVQMLWDRAEPTGYAYTLINDPLPDTPPHEVLILEALGDHQVPNLSTELLARAIGAEILQPSTSNPYGIKSSTGDRKVAMMVDIDYGLPPVPPQNQPMQQGDDPHGKAIDNLPILEMTNLFYETGTIKQMCDGACDPE